MISSVAKELENILESSPVAPISRYGSEGSLCIDPEISPLVLIMSDLESRSRDIYMALQE